MQTVTPSLIASVKSALPQLRISENEPLSAHCSFRIGGPAAALAVPSDVEEAAALCRLLARLGVRPFILGNGTNILFADTPLDLFVIKLGDAMSDISRSGQLLTVGAGATLSKIACIAQKSALTGLEFAHGIPGSLGGALFMNAGAYGGEMRDVCSSVLCLDDRMQLVEVSGAEADFSYRHSRFSDGGYVILGGTLRLAEGDPEEIEAKMRELMQKRRASQPLDKPSAGSTFKRPANGYAAAMIDQSGLRGFSCGAAQVSPKHAGFVVNNGGAGFDDVMAVIEHVQRVVQARFDVLLEPEVRIITGS